jgi:hypothetical protein
MTNSHHFVGLGTADIVCACLQETAEHQKPMTIESRTGHRRQRGTSPGEDARADGPITAAQHAVTDAPLDDSIKGPSNNHNKALATADFQPSSRLIARDNNTRRTTC